MPAEKIATTHVNNGPDGHFTNVLHVMWGAKGGAPEAPDGWVNAGYAHLAVRKNDDREPSNDGYVVLDSDEIDHLIRVLKRVRRQAFRG